VLDRLALITPKTAFPAGALLGVVKSAIIDVTLKRRLGSTRG
jgi:hypothetical protein